MLQADRVAYFRLSLFVWLMMPMMEFVWVRQSMNWMMLSSWEQVRH